MQIQIFEKPCPLLGFADPVWNLIILLLHLPSFTTARDATNLPMEAGPPFACGNGVVIQHPFWPRQIDREPLQSHSCGDPNFNVSCDGKIPVLGLSNDLYRVMKIDYHEKIVRLTYREPIYGLGSCLKATRGVEIPNSGLFNYTAEDELLRFFYNCSLYPPSSQPMTCLNHRTLWSFVFTAGAVPDFNWFRLGDGWNGRKETYQQRGNCTRRHYQVRHGASRPGECWSKGSTTYLPLEDCSVVTRHKFSSYVTWMTWASLEEEHGNSISAEEIRNLYFQQRTEVVDDSSWMNGFMDIIDPAVDSIKRLLKLDKSSSKLFNFSGGLPRDTENEDALETARSPFEKENDGSGFDLDAFVREQLSLEPIELKDQPQEGNRSYRRVRRPVQDTTSRSTV